MKKSNTDPVQVSLSSFDDRHQWLVIAGGYLLGGRIQRKRFEYADPDHYYLILHIPAVSYRLFIALFDRFNIIPF